MVSNVFEVGIVGAGVAGSSCAEVLGKAGVKVALFDHSHPREKPCGGLIDQRVINEFDIPEELLEKEVKWILAERFKSRVKLLIKPSGFLISRKDFDYYMLQRALKNKSVTFFDEKVTRIIKKKSGWILKTNKDRCVKVRVLIGADGCPSFVRKNVFRPIPSKFLATTVGYEFPCSSKYIEKTFAENTIEAYYSHKYVQKGGFHMDFSKKNKHKRWYWGYGNGKEIKTVTGQFYFFTSSRKRVKIP
ncbi:MAG: NAD(P)/FAD-dependent oxidoreductase [Candidatus Bathyarchaeaceae archaeon]